MSKYDDLKQSITEDDDIIENSELSFIHKDMHRVASLEKFKIHHFGKKQNEYTKENMGAQMAVMAHPQLDENLIIRTRDNKNFNVYMNSTTVVASPKYINKFCRFMDTREEGQTVKLYLGAWIPDIFWICIGALVSSIIHCKAKTIAVANGACGVTESFLWMFTDERVVGHYGQLNFSVGPHEVESTKEYKSYYTFFFGKAKELGLLTDEDIKNIIEKNEDICLFGEEVNNKITSNLNNETPIEIVNNDTENEQIEIETPISDESIVDTTDDKTTEDDGIIISGESFSVGY